MASTYVKVTSLEDTLKYFDAGLLYWWSVANEDWFHQSRITNPSSPPRWHEVNSGYWGILIEDGDT